ncbi:MAG TPA: hypothetical protein VMY06_03275 [Sedimentisphaerales bacterium]|nr:hypothetical protein [Sedimentisphaerales bacterium]
MNYRQATLLATKQITTAATETISLAGLDAISRVYAVIELTNNGNNPTNHPLAAMSKIDIVDGSDVIASMSGYGAQAMSYYDLGKMPHNELNYEDNGVARVCVPINFGRFLWDPLLALVPARFRNLQLRIAHNYALGGCSPDNAYLRVFADMFDEKQVSPIGYMQNQEIFSYTPATSGIEYIELPVDNDIRKIVVMNVNDNEEPDVEFESIMIDEAKGKHVIVDCMTMDLIRRSAEVYERFSECCSGHLLATTADEFWLSASKDIQVGGLCDTNDAILTFTWTGGRSRSFYGSAATFFGANVSGRCPHGAVPILFGDQSNPDDWWKVSEAGEARIRLTARSSAAIDTEKTTDLMVQGIQRY